MRYRPGAHRSFRPRHRHWLRGLLLAVLVLAVQCGLAKYVPPYCLLAFRKTFPFFKVYGSSSIVVARVIFPSLSAGA